MHIPEIIYICLTHIHRSRTRAHTHTQILCVYVWCKSLCLIICTYHIYFWAIRNKDGQTCDFHQIGSVFSLNFGDVDVPHVGATIVAAAAAVTTATVVTQCCCCFFAPQNQRSIQQTRIDFARIICIICVYFITCVLLTFGWQTMLYFIVPYVYVCVSVCVYVCVQKNSGRVNETQFDKIKWNIE